MMLAAESLTTMGIIRFIEKMELHMPPVDLYGISLEDK
jgi:hypothetical protein